MRRVVREMNAHVRSVSPEPASEQLTLVLLDYDDTLMSSSWVLTSATIESSFSKNINGVLQESFYLTTEQEITDMGEQELRSVEFLLSMLNEEFCAGKVLLKIVTNGDAAWLRQSLRSFLPLLETYLERHQIDIISARDRYEALFPDMPEEWKAHTFRDEVSKVKMEYETLLRQKQMQWQVSPTRTSQETVFTTLTSDSAEGAPTKAKEQGFSPVSDDISALSHLTPPSSAHLDDPQVDITSGRDVNDRVPLPLSLAAGENASAYCAKPRDTRVNDMLLVSIGDGDYERTACYLVAEELHLDCISIKLLENIGPVVLARELDLLQTAVPRVVQQYWRDKEAYKEALRASGTPIFSNCRMGHKLDLRVSLYMPSEDLVLTKHDGPWREGEGEGQGEKAPSMETDEDEDEDEGVLVGEDDGSSIATVRESNSATNGDSSTFFADRPMMVPAYRGKRKREEVLTFSRLGGAEDGGANVDEDEEKEFADFYSEGGEEDFEGAFNIFQDLAVNSGRNSHCTGTSRARKASSARLNDFSERD